MKIIVSTSLTNAKINKKVYKIFALINFLVSNHLRKIKTSWIFTHPFNSLKTTDGKRLHGQLDLHRRALWSSGIISLSVDVTPFKYGTKPYLCFHVIFCCISGMRCGIRLICVQKNTRRKLSVKSSHFAGWTIWYAAIPVFV